MQLHTGQVSKQIGKLQDCLIPYLQRTIATTYGTRISTMATRTPTPILSIPDVDFMLKKFTFEALEQPQRLGRRRMNY